MLSRTDDAHNYTHSCQWLDRQNTHKQQHDVNMSIHLFTLCTFKSSKPVSIRVSICNNVDTQYRVLHCRFMWGCSIGTFQHRYQRSRGQRRPGTGPTGGRRHTAGRLEEPPWTATTTAPIGQFNLLAGSSRRRRPLVGFGKGTPAIGRRERPDGHLGRHKEDDAGATNCDGPSYG